MDRDLEGSLMALADNLAHPYSRRQVVTIEVLPDDVLLTIFDFYVVRYQEDPASPHSGETSVGNVIAELEHSDRICKIDLSCHSAWHIKKLWTAINARCHSRSVPVIVPASSSRFRFILGWICATSTIARLDFGNYRNYFCLPLTSSIFTFTVFLSQPISRTPTLGAYMMKRIPSSVVVVKLWSGFNLILSHLTVEWSK